MAFTHIVHFLQRWMIFRGQPGLFELLAIHVHCKLLQIMN